MGGSLFGAAFQVVNDSSFQELDRVSKEGNMGAARGFQAGTFWPFQAGGIWPHTE